MSSSSAKKLIKIDVCADTVCPWCFVGKKNLEKAIASSNDRYDFEVQEEHYFELFFFVRFLISDRAIDVNYRSNGILICLILMLPRKASGRTNIT